MKASRVLAFIIVLVVVPATVWAQQQTIRACVKNNNGQVRIVGANETCLPSEHAVDWTSGAAPAVIPPPTVPPPTTPPAPGALRVLDQNGLAIGMLASPGFAARQVGDLWVGLPLSPTGFQINDTLFTFYQSTDCSGDAYMQLDSMSLPRTGTVIRDGTTGKLTVSYAGEPKVASTTILSYAMTTPAGPACYAYWQAPYVSFGKAASLDVTDFVGPFKIVQ